jgi:hypothetical protein
MNSSIAEFDAASLHGYNEQSEAARFYACSQRRRNSLFSVERRGTNVSEKSVLRRKLKKPDYDAGL